MKKFRTRLERLGRRLGIFKALLGRARRRHKKRRLIAEREHSGQLAAQKKADKLRAQGRLVEAERYGRKAARCKHRAEKQHNKSVYWKGKIRYYHRHVEGMSNEIVKVEKELAEWIKTHRPTISGNHARGGTWPERWRLVCLTAAYNCSHGKRRNFYSMYDPGFDCFHEIAPGPDYGHRSDCSLTVTGFAYSSGAHDPNGEGFRSGFTGTLVREVNGWKEVSLSRMMEIGAGYIVYGYGSGHHTEAYCPSKGNPYRTIGHGSAPVDASTVFMFGPNEYQRYYVWLPR